MQRTQFQGQLSRSLTQAHRAAVFACVSVCVLWGELIAARALFLSAQRQLSMTIVMVDMKNFTQLS